MLNFIDICDVDSREIEETIKGFVLCEAEGYGSYVKLFSLDYKGEN